MNNKSSIVTNIVIAIIFLTLGYFLFKSSPDLKQSSAKSNNMSGMHGGSNMAINSDKLNSLIGKTLPDIQLSDKDGKIYSTSDLKGKNTVLFFNEGLMCYPACWNQIASFGNDERFNSEKIQAISIVVDSASDWNKAINKMPQLAKATTMFDSGANTSRQLGMLTTTSSMHRGSLPGHTYVVLDKNAVVKYVFDDPSMAIANNMLFTKIEELN